MTDPQLEAEIAELKEPPKVKLPRKWFLQRAFGVLLTIATVVSLVVATYAAAQGRTALSCLSSLLGDRQAVTQSDARAHIDWSKSLSDLLAHPTDRALYQRFVTVTNQYVDTLAANQAYRDAHPLQRCGADSTPIIGGTR